MHIIKRMNATCKLGTSTNDEKTTTKEREMAQPACPIRKVVFRLTQLLRHGAIRTPMTWLTPVMDLAMVTELAPVKIWLNTSDE